MLFVLAGDSRTKFSVSLLPASFLRVWNSYVNMVRVSSRLLTTKFIFIQSDSSNISFFGLLNIPQVPPTGQPYTLGHFVLSSPAEP